jgi:hypothetical protein
VGVAAGAAGTALLYTMANPTVAALGALNIALYAGPYTLSKRHTEWNTWIGSVVGAVGPKIEHAGQRHAAHFAHVHEGPPRRRRRVGRGHRRLLRCFRRSRGGHVGALRRGRGRRFFPFPQRCCGLVFVVVVRLAGAVRGVVRRRRRGLDRQRRPRWRRRRDRLRWRPWGFCCRGFRRE